MCIEYPKSSLVIYASPFGRETCAFKPLVLYSPVYKMSHQNNSDPSRTLHLSQKSPSVLANAAPGSQSFPFSLLGQSETSATWADYEDLFQACLTAGDDKSAYICLEKLTQRFGTSNTRVMGLRGLYQEAIANGPADLESVLQSYEMTLEEDPMNVVCGY